MSESKMLKARCKKTGLYFGIELKKVGATWKAVNFIDLSDEETAIIMSEVCQSEFVTADNLLACPTCHKRRIGGCSCAKSHRCSSSMGYNFGCVYCNELEIDYSRSSTRTPYTKWAGVSNIPEAVKDRYGNPQGSQYDLAEDGSFKGYKIVVINLCSRFCEISRPRAALEKKGFTVVEYTSMPSTDTLSSLLYDDKSQIWVVSGDLATVSLGDLSLIKRYYESGHGIYIWSDNDPFYADSNRILKNIFSVEMSGNDMGDQVLGIQKSPTSPGVIANHPITTGIVNFYEGITISTVNISSNSALKPLIYSSHGKVVTAYGDSMQRRVLVDGGFTRLYHKWDSAGTDRYIVNAAAWLANIERFGFNN